MLIRFVVLDENLAILAIAMRLFFRNLDNGKYRVAFLEDDVHFLKGAVRSLWIEEVDDRTYECISGTRLLACFTLPK